MKNLLLVLSLFISSQTIAQINKSSISFGPTFCDPLNGSGIKHFKTGIGAGMRGFYPVSRNGSLMVNASYVSFAPQPKNTTSYSLTTFKIGYKTFFNHSNFYVYADAGIVVITAKDKLYPNLSTTTTTGLGLGFGYSLPVTKNSYIDISPGLNLNNAALFGRRLSPELNVSYRINLSKK